MPGKLFIVGTPIGNMEDISLRALRILREADLIAAEDTRHTARLLTRHGIDIHSPPTEGSGVGAFRLISYHQFNEAKRTSELLKALQEGRTIALVSDAGMPTISDPGHRLIHAVLEWNERCESCHPEPVEGSLSSRRTSEIPRQARNDSVIKLEIIPGPSAITAAMAASGFSSAGVPPVSLSGSFLFYGFLPHKSAQRRKALTLLAPLPYMLVFFESPYRLVKSLRDMHEALGNRQAVIARELTKKFEEIIRGDLATILKKLENRTIKGEITVVVEGQSA